MKKQKNATRIIAIVLVALMALALIPIAASADAAPTEGECTIIFDGNGGTTGGESPQTQVYTMGETPALTANPFSRVGYSFDGWNTQADGLGSSVPANATVAALNTLDTWVDSTITLYAKWTPILTIVYATTVSGQESVTRTYDAQCTALPTAGALGFTNENHEFVKWQVEGSVDQPEAGDSYPASPVTEPTTYNLTTIWAHLYTVTFNVNGGTGSPAPSTQRDGFNVTFPATGTVTRTGYILKGWSESQNANPDDASALVNPGTYSKTADVTLYAIWKADPVTINYLSNGGSGNMDSDTILRNTDYPVLDNGFTAPAKHKFVCWKDEDHGNKTYDPSKNELLDWTTIGSEEAVVNLTAQWAQLRNVKFYSTTVTVSGYPKTVAVVDGATLGSAFSDGKLPSPTSTDYNFLGWYDNASCAGDPVTADLVIADADKQLFAKWVSKTIQVTFDAGGGSGTMDPAKAPRDGEYTLPDNEFLPPEAEMAFVGWKIGSTEEIKTPGEKVSTVGYGDTGLLLTAQWMDNAVTVTFDPNGGTATGGVKTQRMYRESASALSQLSTLNYTPPENKVFAGWSRTETGAVQFADGESVQWNGSSDAKNYAETNAVTLYAKWQDNLAGSVAVTKGGTPVRTDTTFKAGDTVTATATVTAPIPTPSPLYYKWVDGSGNVLASGQVNGTSANYEVKAADLGKTVRALFCTNNSFAEDNTIRSDAFTLKPDASETVAVTVKLVNAAGNSAATVNGSRTADATTPEITIKDIIKGADVTLALTADDTQQVKSVVKTVGSQSEEQPLDRMTYTMQFTAAATVTVTFEAKGLHTNPKAVVNVSGDIPDAAKSAITTIAGSNPCCVYDVVPCWNGVISNPVAPSDLPAAVGTAGLSFTLPYPAGSGKVASTGKDISTKMDQYYKVRAWHWNGTGYDQIPATRVKGNALLASGITVTGQKDFSPMAADLTPIPLAGTVKLSGLVSDTTSGATAAVGKTLTASFTPSGPAVVGKLTYRWEYKDGTEWKLLATGQTYTPTKSYRDRDLRCVATSDFETEPTTGWPNKEFKVIEKPNPEWQRDIVNNGGVQTGIVKNVTSDMMWSGPSVTKPGTSAPWHSITGTTFPVTEQGYYWVRFADDTSNTNVSDPVFVANYFTVKCHPDSVSTNRLYFEATTSGTSAEVHSGQLSSHPDVIYDNNNSDHYWIKEEGKGITVYAKTSNSKYYKITAIKAIPTETSSFSKTVKSDSLSVTIGSKYTVQPYDVWASAGVYGSKTGDTSHLELWVELAALSLMGLGAALVLGRRKLKAQK